MTAIARSSNYIIDIIKDDELSAIMGIGKYTASEILKLAGMYIRPSVVLILWFLRSVGIRSKMVAL